MKLCVFQGTFNPVHNLHLEIVDFIHQKYQFDKIMIIPAYKPPHKEIDNNLALHRLNMVKTAFEDRKYCEVSEIEYEKEDFSYTYLTIKELYKRYKIDGKIYFIIGSDAILKIMSWYEIDKLKKLLYFIIIGRGKVFEKKQLNFLLDNEFNFEYTEKNFQDLSSSYIRECVKNGENISNIVPKKIGEYIEKNELYNS